MALFGRSDDTPALAPPSFSHRESAVDWAPDDGRGVVCPAVRLTAATRRRVLVSGVSMVFSVNLG